MKPVDTTYRGWREHDGSVRVQVEFVDLDPAESLKHVSHSPVGFEWGYCDIASRHQLAFAILLDYTGDVDLTHELYQDFERDYVARFGSNDGDDIYGWRVDGDSIRNFLQYGREHQPPGRTRDRSP